VPEIITGEDHVSRHLFAPAMGFPNGDLIWECVFMFKKERECRESVVWRRYAATLTDVHELGCAKQTTDRNSGKVNCTYFGALTANVDQIRRLRSKTGARFQVLHAPQEGIHHAEVSYLHDRQLTKNDKAELKHGIKNTFLDRANHTCPDGV
jgi:hypothetical protein